LVLPGVTDAYGRKKIFKDFLAAENAILATQIF
jgi:hypothetical protein